MYTAMSEGERSPIKVCLENFQARHGLTMAALSSFFEFFEATLVLSFGKGGKVTELFETSHGFKVGLATGMEFFLSFEAVRHLIAATAEYDSKRAFLSPHNLSVVGSAFGKFSWAALAVVAMEVIKKDQPNLQLASQLFLGALGGIFLSNALNNYKKYFLTNTETSTTEKIQDGLGLAFPLSMATAVFLGPLSAIAENPAQIMFTIIAAALFVFSSMTIFKGVQACMPKIKNALTFGGEALVDEEAAALLPSRGASLNASRDDEESSLTSPHI